MQKPHPPLFQPFASSEKSIRWCAEEGVTAILPLLHPRTEVALFQLYSEVSGRPLGEGMGVLRDVIIADTDEEAKALWESSAVFVGDAWFEPFGLFKGLLDPSSGEMPDVFAEGLGWSAPSTRSRGSSSGCSSAFRRTGSSLGSTMASSHTRSS